MLNSSAPVVKSINDPAYRRFLQRLRDARKEAKISQEELARRLDHHQTYVSKVEKAERMLDVMEYLHWAQAVGEDPLLLLAPLAFEVHARRRPRKRTVLKPDQT